MKGTTHIYLYELLLYKKIKRRRKQYTNTNTNTNTNTSTKYNNKDVCKQRLLTLKDFIIIMIGYI